MIAGCDQRLNLDIPGSGHIRHVSHVGRYDRGMIDFTCCMPQALQGAEAAQAVAVEGTGVVRGCSGHL